MSTKEIYMKYGIVSALILSVGVIIGCQQSKSTDDAEVLKNVLISYFDGIRDKDFKKMTEATTDDFILFEMGKVWNNDSVFVNIKRNLPYKVEYKFDDFKVSVDNMLGHMSYYNKATFVFSDTTIHFSWVESAAFRKTDGRWKMNFLHITKRRTAEK